MALTWNPELYPPDIKLLFFREYYEERLHGRRPAEAEHVARTLVSAHERRTDTNAAFLGCELWARERMTDDVQP